MPSSVTKVANPARRGDLVIVESRHVNHYQDGRGLQEHFEFEVCVVDTATRNGLVRTVRRVWAEKPMQLKHWVGLRATYVIPQVDIDVDGAVGTARKHTWRKGRVPKYYDTLEEVKEALRKHSRK